ncbi:MAG: helix-turn-helix transcriptional regulator [Clostridiales bacterium]|nr:helix-turn-helix transcriptional regulator [Clostridiales bacterium]
MMRAYSELYLNDAKNNLADFFEYAVSDCHLDMEWVVRLFVQSGYAEKFERGNPAVIAGMSGIELARKVMDYAYPNKEYPENIFSQERSKVYWAGWALAEYQWYTCKRFKDIFSRISFTELVSMYKVYHEMDIGQFMEAMEKKYDSVKRETRLKTVRENRGISQAELAKLSGVKLRSIQMYEQKGNDIDKAQAGTVYKLSRVLGCTVEDLLESPEK